MKLYTHLQKIDKFRNFKLLSKNEKEVKPLLGYRAVSCFLDISLKNLKYQKIFYTKDS